MPTYPYRCRDCGHEFEEFQSMSEDALTECPECGGAIHRIISGGAGLIFKGSGFYITDYRKESYKKDAAKDKSSGSSDSAGSSGTGSSSGSEATKSDTSKPKKNDS